MTLWRKQLDGTLVPVTNQPTLTVRSIGATRPSTTGWAVNDAWIDTDASNQIRLWTGSAFLPAETGAPVEGTLLLSDDFTGTDGAVWNASKWALGRNNLGGPTAPGGATLLAGTGVIAASSSSINYDGNATVSRRALISDTADINMTFSFKWDTTTSFLWAHARHSTTTLDRLDGYSLYLAKETGVWGVQKATGYATTTIGTEQTITWAASTWYKARFYCVGTTVQAKVWLASASEPGSYAATATDSAYTSAGKTGLSISGGVAATTQRRAFIDDLVIRAS